MMWTWVAEVVELHFYWGEKITGLEYFIYCWMSALKQDFLCEFNSILFPSYRSSFSPCDVQAAGAHSRLCCNCSNQFKSLKYNEIGGVVITDHFYCIFGTLRLDLHFSLQASLHFFSFFFFLHIHTRNYSRCTAKRKQPSRW